MWPNTFVHVVYQPIIYQQIHCIIVKYKNNKSFEKAAALSKTIIDTMLHLMKCEGCFVWRHYRVTEMVTGIFELHKTHTKQRKKCVCVCSLTGKCRNCVITVQLLCVKFCCQPDFLRLRRVSPRRSGLPTNRLDFYSPRAPKMTDRSVFWHKSLTASISLHAVCILESFLSKHEQEIALKNKNKQQKIPFQAKVQKCWH